MGGGDKVASHNCTRDNLFKQTQLANVAPVLEAVGVLSGERDQAGGGAAMRGDDMRKRPADVLVCRAQEIRTGNGGGRGRGRVALDVGIVCPQAPGHLRDAAREVLGAAEQYCRDKCGKQRVEEKCREMGVELQALIFESTGGVACEAEVVIKCLNRIVALNTGVPYGDVATRFWQRLSIDIQRHGHRALVRRVTGNVGCRDGLSGIVEGVELLVEPGL